MEVRAARIYRWPCTFASLTKPITRPRTFSARPSSSPSFCSSFSSWPPRPGGTGSFGYPRRKPFSSLRRLNPSLLKQSRRLKNESRVTIDKQYSNSREAIKETDTLPLNGSSNSIKIAENELQINGKCVFSKVPGNVALSDASGIGLECGAFIGAAFSEKNSRHIVPLGVFRDVRFLSLFRFKLWWMAQKMGNSGREIPVETQFLLTEIKDGLNNDVTYAVFLPLLEGPFRMSLQGNDRDEVELVLESGDPAITESSFKHSLLINCGTNPFQVTADAVRALELHLKTFQHREKKKIPGIVDWFGWCTWDAFYTDVSAKGVEEGLRSLSEGGTPPRFVIIDDGWQSVVSDDETTEGKQQIKRLDNIKENYKFEKNEKENEGQDTSALGIKHIVDIAKKNYSLKYVYVWHAITGYWGGVKPDVPGTKSYDSQVRYPVPSPGVLSNEPGMHTDMLTTQGIGLVSPKKVFEFYNNLHSYLAAAGIDGVKVDAQCLLETLGGGLGGRVELTKLYHQALDASTALHFPDNGCIACMSHNTDALYCSKQTTVVRASDDFYPRDPVTHTIHVASVAYNSIFIGEIMLPDWDMFHSVHPAAEYHAAARAVGGCPVYVSDKPGCHNFHLLKKLVLPDGSILRATLPGRPTIDCLFSDPTRDGKSLLKIWNMNKFTGVLGVFNCQGAAWSNYDKKNVFHDSPQDSISGCIRVGDVQLIAEIAPQNWDGDCSVYSHSGKLLTFSKNEEATVTLKVLEHEVYTITPIQKWASEISFAPIGLIEMFNSGGAIKALEYSTKETMATVNMKMHGCGRMGAYSSAKPKNCFIDNSAVDFSYENSSGLLTVVLPMTTEEGVLWDVTIQF